MRLPAFVLAQPDSVAEAIALLSAGEECRLIAGGTALVPMLRLGLLKPDRVISLHRVAGIDRIAQEGDRLHVGATVTIADLQASSLARARWPLLAEAAGRVATPAIRTTATIGGNIAYAEAASDPAPALLCLDASVRVAGASGERTIPLAQF